MAAEQPEQPVEKAKVPRRTAWLIWGLVALLAALVLGVGLSLALHAWYIKQNNQRWCQFYTEVTSQTLTDHVLQLELQHLAVETGCK
jgi:uncharacterized protein HemX